MILTGLFYSGTIKRRGSGSPELRGWCQQRRRLPMSGELTTSLTFPAGGKFPRSSTWTMTSWRTGRVCPATWPQLEAPPRLRARAEVTTRCRALPHLSSLLLLLTPLHSHQWDCSEAFGSRDIITKFSSLT